jgi:hypothetical protein
MSTRADALWFFSDLSFRQAGDLYYRDSPSLDQQGNVSLTVGLRTLNEALLATLTQMSADIAQLKAEIASLKAKHPPHLPTGSSFGR